MSVVVPFLLLIVAGGIAAYHRLRLAWWAAITASLLVVAWLFGANGVATLVAALLVALIAIPLLVPGFRKARITTPLLAFYTKLLPPLSDTERTALEAGTVGDGLLSMGMSGDFEAAIEGGSTCVRVGQAIFGARATPDSHYWPETPQTA